MDLSSSSTIRAVSAPPPGRHGRSSTGKRENRSGCRGNWRYRSCDKAGPEAGFRAPPPNHRTVFGFAFVTHRLGPQCPVSHRPPCRLRPQAPLADVFEHRLFSLVRAGLGTRQIKAAAGGHGGAPFRPGGQPSISATIRCSSRRESPCGRLVSEETLEEAPMVATGRLDRLSKWFLVVICMISCADFPRLLIIELNGACCAPRRDLRPGYVHER